MGLHATGGWEEDFVYQTLQGLLGCTPEGSPAAPTLGTLVYLYSAG